jgi:adenylate kinase family enzyme
MLGFKNLLKAIRKQNHRLKVYALVGDSGTGKSFRSRLIAEKYQINLIVDDGLLIRGQQILAGRSAKREVNRMKAVKRAIFEDPVQSQEVRDVLAHEKFDSILVIGTSEKMVARIAERLKLPYPDQVIYIEDVATHEEIALAMESRQVQGKHVIPVPMVEVKKDPRHKVLDSVRFFLERRPFLFWKKRVVEKTVVQPPFSRRGKISISRVALSQMIMHCVEEFDPNIKINKIIIDERTREYALVVKLRVAYGVRLGPVLSGLKDYIITWIERFSGLHIKRLDLTVDEVLKDVNRRDEG